MKNQYVADIGDYGKYGLLRHLAAGGVKIGVNWYLTPDDNSNDGKHISYLKKNSDRFYDEELYLAMQSLVFQGKRDVTEVEKLKLIKDAVYYHERLDITGVGTREDKRKIRERWHQKALQVCKGADLIFLDPDNGLRKGEPSNMKVSSKYAYAREAADYYRLGKHVMYYCQKGRRTQEQWAETKKIMAEILSDAALCGVTFRRGTQRTYLFVVHQEAYEKYYGMLKEFLDSEWGRVFCWEVVF